jgi:hypothetical protein
VSDVLLHVYGVVESSARLPAELTGRGDQPVRQVGDDALAVLVTEIADDARVGRDDLLAHAHLLEAVAADATVIPTRFGVLVPDEETVRREFLGSQREHLLDLLRAFQGCIQVTVHATYEEDAALREVLRRDPALAELRDAAAGADTEAQVRLGEAVAGALAALREGAADMVVDWLRPYALATAVNEVRGAYDVANVSLLVRRSDRTRVDAAVGDLDRQLRGEMMLRYVGPQPPYAFLDHVVAEDRSWA